MYDNGQVRRRHLLMGCSWTAEAAPCITSLDSTGSGRNNLSQPDLRPQYTCAWSKLHSCQLQQEATESQAMPGRCGGGFDGHTHLSIVDTHAGCAAEILVVQRALWMLSRNCSRVDSMATAWEKTPFADTRITISPVDVSPQT
jgi:hypothetical protein